MLTKTEQNMIALIHDGSKNKDGLSSFYSNERSLYKSALKLKRMGLMKYGDGNFSLTFKGFMLSIILIDIQKSNETKEEFQ